ncbi:MAG: helix-turn-helix domain-containing protein [Ruminococcus sp.]|nr:helix-turn-helix domain-containing protein [Ruminococcus sp.]
MQDGVLIAKLRCKKNITQNEMAKLLKISLPAYKLYETNLRVMKISELNVLSNYFNISLNTLLGLSKDFSSTTEQKAVNYKILKYNIKILRRKAKLTQASLAKEFDMSTNTISRFESETRRVDAVFLYKLAKKFNISVDFMCGKTLDKNIA